MQCGPRGKSGWNEENNFRHAAKQFRGKRVGQRHARDQRSQEANAPFANANSISNKWNGVGGIGNAGQRQRGRRVNGLSDQLKCNVDAQSPSACFDNANKKRGGKFARCWGAQKYNKRNR